MELPVRMLEPPVVALQEGFGREMLVVVAALDILLQNRHSIVDEQLRQQHCQDDIHSWDMTENDDEEDTLLQGSRRDRQGVLEDSHVAAAVVLLHTDSVEDHHVLDKEDIQEVDHKILEEEEGRLYSRPCCDELLVPLPCGVVAVGPEEMTASARPVSCESELYSVKVDDPCLVVLLVLIRMQ